MNLELVEQFKNRELKAKQIFVIQEISKNDAYDFVKQYHYLGDAKFFSMYSYGLFCEEELVGCATYSNPQGAVALKGWFGLQNDDQTVLELSRLCMLPCLNGTNATSYLLGNSMKMLKQHNIRAITTLADSFRHIGSIYQVCNFKYYGLTDTKTDFFTNNADGKMLNNPRMKTKDAHGVWLPRTRKHRYCYILDKDLKPLYKEQPHPTIKGTIANECCYGNELVYDERFNEWWTCPRCCGKLEKIDNVQVILYDDFDSIKKIKQTSNNIYIIDYNNKFNINIIKNNKFDIVAIDTNIGDNIRKYLCNCRQVFTLTSDKEDNYIEDFAKEFLNE